MTKLLSLVSVFLFASMANANIISCSHVKGEDTYNVATDKKSIGIFKTNSANDKDLLFYGNAKILDRANTVFNSIYSLELDTKSLYQHDGQSSYLVASLLDCKSESSNMKEWLIEGLTK